MIRITHPDKGNVFINNEKITRYPLQTIAKRIGIFASRGAIFKKLTVSQNIEAILELKHGNRG